MTCCAVCCNREACAFMLSRYIGAWPADSKQDRVVALCILCMHHYFFNHDAENVQQISLDLTYTAHASQLLPQVHTIDFLFASWKHLLELDQLSWDLFLQLPPLLTKESLQKITGRTYSIKHGIGNCWTKFCTTYSFYSSGHKACCVLRSIWHLQIIHRDILYRPGLLYASHLSHHTSNRYVRSMWSN